LIRNDVEAEVYPDDDEGSNIDLREYVGLVLKNKWIVVAGLVAGIALGIFYGRSRPIVYTTSASMLISSEAPHVLGRDVDQAVEYGANRWSGDRATFYNSQLTIMRSQAVASFSVKEGKLDEVPEVAGTGTPAQRFRAAYAAVRSSMSVSIADQERTVWVTATHKNPVAAAAIANAVIKGYQAFNRDEYRAGNEEAIGWLSKELDNVEVELAAADKAIDDFKRNNDLLSFSIEDRRSLLGQSIAHYSEQASEARTSRIGLEVQHNKIDEANKQAITDSSIFELAGSATGRLLREQYLAATIDLQSLSANLGPLHPTRLEQTERVEKLKVALAGEAKVVKTTALDRYKNALALEGRMNGEVQRLKQQAFDLGPKEIEYGVLLRQRDEALNRAAHLRERYNENNMAGRLQSTNVRPLDSAYIPGQSSAKKWSYYVGASAMLGLMMSIGLILLVHQLDSRIHRVGQIEELGGSSFLGALPIIKNADNREPNMMSRFQEAIRIVRTNLSFLAPDVDQRVIMVTSPQPQDGKSTTAYWMAVSMSQMGKRVLLVDADMRSPSLHNIIGIQRDEGLSELIVGEIKLADALRDTDFKNVKMIPAGRPIRDPAESIASKRFAGLLDSFRDEFDIIIVDTPPVLPVADASLMCRVVDVALVIGRCGSTEKNALGMALSQIRRAKPKSLGVIANAAGVRAERYYYKGYDGYAYGETPDLAYDASVGDVAES